MVVVLMGVGHLTKQGLLFLTSSGNRAHTQEVILHPFPDLRKAHIPLIPSTRSELYKHAIDHGSPRRQQRRDQWQEKKKKKKRAVTSLLVRSHSHMC